MTPTPSLFFENIQCFAVAPDSSHSNYIITFQSTAHTHIHIFKFTSI